MLNDNFDVLTPLSKVHRVSRRIADPETFTAEPGVFLALTSTGEVENVKDTSKVIEICISSSRAYDYTNPTGLAVYEANDTKVGSITTIPEVGTRFTIGDDYFASTSGAGVGEVISVSTATGTEGELNVGAASESITVAKITGMNPTASQFEITLTEQSVNA